MNRILSVSSSRADIGILAPVWQALAAYEQVDLHIFLTGMHCRHPIEGIDVVAASATLHRGGGDLGGSADENATQAMAEIANAAGRVMAAVAPDVVVVVGDRLDMLPAATASLPFNLPLVHLHGGEITEGAIDDRIRNALSMLSHWHCVASAGSRDRLLEMGLPPERVVVTGAPGLDTLLSAPELSAEAFAADVGLDALEGDLSLLRLVTVHPETNVPDPLMPLDAVLAALDERPAPTLITASNSDPGGAESSRRIASFAARRSWCHYVDTLGSRLYPNALRHAALMMGNSSSGVIEAGLFGLPVINVGDRQRGREQGENVRDVPASAGAIVSAMNELAGRGGRFPGDSPYGDGAAGPRVADVVLNGLAMRACDGSPLPADRAVGQWSNR